MSSRFTSLLLILTLAVAVWLRLWGITQTPYNLWVDEAWFGARGEEVVRGVNYVPLSEPGVGVGNSLYQIYAAAAMQLVGVPTAFSSRLGSALTGILAVIALYPALLNILSTTLEPERRRLAALAATAFYAVNFSAVFISRAGTQNISAALVAIVSFALLYLAFEHNSLRWAALAGGVMGLAPSTYEAALGIPLVAGLYALTCLPGYASRRRWAAIVLTMTGTALLTFSPLLVIYIQRPGIFLTHILDTTTMNRGDSWAVVGHGLDGLVKTFLGLFWQGDAYPGQNIPGRPMFDGLIVICLAIGVGWAVYRWRQPGSRLLILWAAIQILPSIITANPPSFPRLVAATPALAALAGIGVVAIGPRRWQLPALVFTAAISGVMTAYAYFSVWPKLPGAFERGDAMRQMAEQAIEDSAMGADVWVSPKNESTVQNIFGLLFEKTNVHLLNPSECIPLPVNLTHDTTYGVAILKDKATLSTIESLFPACQQSSIIFHPAGYAEAMFYTALAGTKPIQPQPVNAKFDTGLELVGYRLDKPQARAGEVITVYLYWSGKPAEAGATAFVHIGRGDASDPLLAVQDGLVCGGMAGATYTEGYWFVETRSIKLADEAPIGAYDLRLGLYDLGTGRRATVLSANTRSENGRVILGPLEIVP